MEDSMSHVFLCEPDEENGGSRVYTCTACKSLCRTRTDDGTRYVQCDPTELDLFDGHAGLVGVDLRHLPLTGPRLEEVELGDDRRAVVVEHAGAAAWSACAATPVLQRSAALIPYQQALVRPTDIA